MAFGLKGSHIVAMLIAGGVIGWMLQGDIIVGGQENSDNATPPPAERASASTALQQVRYVSISPQERAQSLSLRGRTEATAVVQIRSETNGVVEQRYVNKGDVVKQGDLLCSLEAGVRQSAIQQAKTSLAQAETDFKANEELKKQGYATNSQLLALQTALDAAKSQLEQAEREMEKTKIVAKASGIVQDPVAEVGNLLNSGDVCATVVQNNPMNFIGQVSEAKVSAIKVGDQAMVRLVSGQAVTGQIKFISPTADAQTRTFKVEIEMPNNEGALRDGITADAAIALKSDEAYSVQSSWLTLSDNGDVGVRVINSDNIVEFVPVQILAQTPETMWVGGLTPGLKVITLGQEYVTAGQEVIAVEQTAQTQTGALPSDLEKNS